MSIDFVCKSSLVGKMRNLGNSLQGNVGIWKEMLLFEGKFWKKEGNFAFLYVKVHSKLREIWLT